MVGANLDKTNARFYITKTPHSLPTYFDDVIQNFVEYARDINRESLGAPATLQIISPSGSRSTFDASIEAYSGGSDHYIFTDGAISIPAVMFGTWPDVYYHTNEDTPDKVDPTTLRRVAFMGVTSSIYLSSLGAKDIPQLASEVMGRAQSRLGLDEKKAYSLLDKTAKEDLPQGFKEAQNIIHQAYLREAKTLMSCVSIAEGNKYQNNYLKEWEKTLIDEEKIAQKRLKTKYHENCRQLDVKPKSILISNKEKQLRQVIPYRVMDYKGPIGSGFLEERLGEAYNPEQLLLYQNLSGEDVVWFGNIPYETLNFVDGKRSIAEIRDCISAEYTPISLEAVEEYLVLLKKADIIRF